MATTGLIKCNNRIKWLIEKPLTKERKIKFMRRLEEEQAIRREKQYKCLHFRIYDIAKTIEKKYSAIVMIVKIFFRKRTAAGSFFFGSITKRIGGFFFIAGESGIWCLPFYPAWQFPAGRHIQKGR